jgi:magnesium-transporting ATPase (P-type)
MGRVGHELLATLGSLGVLVVISVLAGAALSRVVEPALATLISYFTIAVMYLRFVDDPSSELVLVMLFSVILFLVLNLALIVCATTFFLAKVHRIFQQRFSEQVPLSSHKKFWKWGSVSVVWALLFPLIYMLLARAGIEQINAQVMADTHDAASVNWTVLMLAGPLLLIVGFAVALWATRVFAAVRFLMRYDVRGGSMAALGIAEGAATLFGRS